jgi:hypothetical protein
MQNKRWQICALAFLLAILVLPGHILASGISDTFIVPVMPNPELSSDGNTLYNAPTIGIAVDDPNPDYDQIRIPAPESLTDQAAATSTFQITYQTAGQTDPWGETCYAVPDATKAAFNYAGIIWGNLLQSSVPIKIQVCWGSLTGSTLGYSGGGPLHRDFTNAPRSGTWFTGSLANSLAGTDLDATKYDMYITYNKNFTWYTGTDANPPAGDHDLVTVALHEICHGLNFAGSMSYASGSASWGYGTGYPNIYDTFIRDGSDNSIINTSVYPNPSSALGTAVTSNNLWFHGAQAMSGNGGTRVKMYAPSSWAGGSSYSHLDYTTFASGSNRLMRYAISSGTAIHDPGPVTMGLLKDVGWKTGGTTTDSAQITSLWPVTGAQAGKTSTLWAQVKNTGSAVLPSDSLVWFYVTGPNWTNYWVGSASVSGLGAGSTAWYAYNWPIPSSATAGTYTYWARVYRGSTAISDWSSSQSFTVTGSSSQMAVMTSPANGSTLTSTTQTFVWTNVGAPQYWLYLGTSPGAYNIYNQSTGTATSRAVSGLPSNGSMIYARLWTLSGSTWLYNDYSYRAYGSGAKAVMTSPANGSTLTSTTQTFVWTNVGAPQYWLYLGTSPGAYNIYNQSTGTATSRTVSGLPSNGSMIYARLWTLSGSTWLYNDYSYRAYGSGGFNEQFNGSAANWVKDSGSWGIASSAWYYTAGRAGYSDTSTYNKTFSNLDYSARLWRSGTVITSANRLIIGANGAIGSDGHFSNEYTFQYTTDGFFSIFKRVDGVNTAVVDWTENAAIIQGSAWNTLRVKVFGSSVEFYINGIRVAYGTDSSLTAGSVGVGMYRDASSTGDGFWVDWATLTIPSSLTVDGAIDKGVVIFDADAQVTSGNLGSPDGL